MFLRFSGEAVDGGLWWWCGGLVVVVWWCVVVLLADPWTKMGRGEREILVFLGK